MILVSFCRIFNGRSDEINLFWRCSSPLNGTVPYGITFVGEPVWYQVADPIRTRSTRSRVNARLIHTNFIPVPNVGWCNRVSPSLTTKGGAFVIPVKIKFHRWWKRINYLNSLLSTRKRTILTSSRTVLNAMIAIHVHRQLWLIILLLSIREKVNTGELFSLLWKVWERSIILTVSFQLENVPFNIFPVIPFWMQWCNACSQTIMTHHFVLGYSRKG